MKQREPQSLKGFEHHMSLETPGLALALDRMRQPPQVAGAGREAEVDSPQLFFVTPHQLFPSVGGQSCAYHTVYPESPKPA